MSFAICLKVKVIYSHCWTELEKKLKKWTRMQAIPCEPLNAPWLWSDSGIAFVQIVIRKWQILSFT